MRAIRMRAKQTVAAVAVAMAVLGHGQADAAAPALTAEGLVLVVNKQQPEGRKLAERYAELRKLPADRIIEIDVPDKDELTPEDFDASVAAVVRREIEGRGLREKTQCLVTFYGVPLRVRDRDQTAFERNELKAIVEPSMNILRIHFKGSVEAVEAVAMELQPGFNPDKAAVTSEQLAKRGAAAETIIRAGLPKLSPAERTSVAERLAAAQATLQQMPAIPAAPATKPAAPTQAQVSEWLSKPGDPEARRQLREAAHATGNIFQLLVVIESQQRALGGGEGQASLDSELSCLWLTNFSKQKWVANPWHWRASDAVAQQFRPQVVRVSRIDGPTPAIARRVFEEAIAAEARGLSGEIVLDARGLPANNVQQGSYEAGDQSIRNVVKFLPGGDDLKPIFDNNPDLLPDKSSERAAIYCGWYLLRNYKPTVKLVPGSIAWHIASLEMISLRDPNEGGWCRGLMIDGADVTMGPVGEPYLMAFPPADEMLPLLMTGKTTIAEAYWATNPVTSWKMVLIGDPLYRPFAKKPAVEASQLPPGMAKVLTD